MNGVALARDGSCDGIGIEDEARFGALFDHIDDTRVFSPEGRSDPDARCVTHDLDEPRHGIGTCPWVGQRDFVCTQSNDHEIWVVVSDQLRQFAMPSGGVRSLSRAHFVEDADGFHHRAQRLGKPRHDKRIAHVQHDRSGFDGNRRRNGCCQRDFFVARGIG